jgi:hypothetical protein
LKRAQRVDFEEQRWCWEEEDQEAVEEEDQEAGEASG